VKARIERDWARPAVKVWLYEERERGPVMVGFDEHGHATFQILEEGAEMPGPSMVLPEQALEALVKEAMNILPPSEVTVDAMKDARATRDRLLAIVERTVS
jgi:hypothetical protein